MNKSHLEQQHPREQSDRLVVDRLLNEKVTNYNLAELARLRIRYQNFPGAFKLQQDLDVILNRWELTEEKLYEKTRQIHAKGSPYQTMNSIEETQDWS